MNRIPSVGAPVGFLAFGAASVRVSAISWSLGLKMTVSLLATSMLSPVSGCL